MQLRTAPYAEQQQSWPPRGRHILAQYDDDSVIVYQAYRPEIGDFAAEHGYFGGEFSYSRMSWIKPNFLWMMYRSGWGTKGGQEVTLAVRLRRAFFERVLEAAVHSSYRPAVYGSREAWQRAVRKSPVRLQWDPDHGPTGGKLERRAIQLGLRGKVLAEYGREAIVEIVDVSDFVAQQRLNIAPGRRASLLTPSERPYLPARREVGERLDLAAP
ncbi:MAG: DUF4291 domain-containing protein [bacterium]|nr:DUF4291 domain-containing protein [bacterium]